MFGRENVDAGDNSIRHQWTSRTYLWTQTILAAILNSLVVWNPVRQHYIGLTGPESLDHTDDSGG